jgi:large subunit ribosomal protein L31
MRKKIHPSYYEATITCACGHSFRVGSTKQQMKVEICAACHPLTTGKRKLVDTGGRVERYRARLARAESTKKRKRKSRRKSRAEVQKLG